MRISIPTFVTEDGEQKREEWPFNLVKNVDQAAQLATYRAWDTREIAPITVVCHPRLRHYRPGECLNILLPEDELDTPAIIQRRSIDPLTFKITLELIGETAAKHAYCLGQTGTPPPTPALGQTAEERDAVAAGAALPLGYISTLISISSVTDADPADGLIQATDTAITIESHIRTYQDKSSAITGDTLTVDDQGDPLVASTGSMTQRYHIYYDDADRAGGAVSFKVALNSFDAANSSTYPTRHYVGTIAMDVAGGTGTTSGGATPPGWEPEDYCVSDDTPILLADGSTCPAGALTVGVLLKTRHEKTLRRGIWPVTAISFIRAPVYICRFDDVTIRATANHLFHIGGQWTRADAIGTPAGMARVARITVADAHTYISAGILSQNIKA